VRNIDSVGDLPSPTSDLTPDLTLMVQAQRDVASPTGSDHDAKGCPTCSNDGTSGAKPSRRPFSRTHLEQADGDFVRFGEVFFELVTAR
jgi:hypothetical protein